MSQMDLNDDFARKVAENVQVEPWAGPKVYFNAEGDCIELLLSNDNYRARRLDSLVTVYERREDDELVGALIKGVRRFIGEVVQILPGFKIEIINGKVKLEYLFAAGLWRNDVSENVTLVKTYRKLLEAAERASLEVELEMA